MSDMPGKKWTQNEVKQLTYAHSLGYRIEEIAELLHRTPFEVQCNLESLGVKSNKHVNHDKPWTKKDFKQLRIGMECGVSIGKMAEILNRYPKDIECQLKLLDWRPKNEVEDYGRYTHKLYTEYPCVFKEQQMYEYKEYIFGKNVKDMGEEDLLGAIEKARSHQDRVDKTAESGSYVETMARKTEKVIEVAMRELDERFS